MPLLSQTDIAAMILIQRQSLHDTATLKKFKQGSPDDYGYISTGFDDTVGVACGFKSKSVNDTMGNTEISTLTAELRLPIDIEITGLDQILLTHRYGTEITPVLFNVSGTPIIGVTGIIVQLIKVTK